MTLVCCHHSECVMVGLALTVRLFPSGQVRNRLLISARHIKTPSLLSHCPSSLFSPSSSALVPDSRPFIHVVPQFAPGKSLRLDQLCDFVFTPLSLLRRMHDFASGIAPFVRAVLPIEFPPQFCRAAKLSRYLSISEGLISKNDFR